MADTQTTTDAFFRSQLARILTTWALIFLAFVATVALIVAGLYSYYAPTETVAAAAAKERAAVFFDLVKYLLATI